MNVRKKYMIQKEVLYGGRKGKISKEENKVIRPGNKWTSHVQSFLSFMHENGFNNIPKPYGINESGMEMFIMTVCRMRF